VTGSRPGLAVERTVLAWTRTWLAVGGCGLLLVRMSAGSTPRVAAALAGSAVALVVTTLAGRRRATHLRAVAATPPALRPATRAAAVTAATVGALGVVAAVLAATR
jgi:uncharacterized membrane protein YidH (DUF202 family)